MKLITYCTRKTVFIGFQIHCVLLFHLTHHFNYLACIVEIGHRQYSKSCRKNLIASCFFIYYKNAIENSSSVVKFLAWVIPVHILPFLRPEIEEWETTTTIKKTTSKTAAHSYSKMMRTCECIWSVDVVLFLISLSFVVMECFLLNFCGWLDLYFPFRLILFLSKMFCHLFWAIKIHHETTNDFTHFYWCAYSSFSRFESMHSMRVYEYVCVCVSV